VLGKQPIRRELNELNPVRLRSGLAGVAVTLALSFGLPSAAAALSFSPGAHAVGSLPQSVAIDDLNADGNPDLAVADGGSSDVSVLLGNGSGGFSAAAGSPFAVGAFPDSVAIGDVNGDGKPDLAIANGSSDEVSVLLGNGVGGFSAAAGSPFAVGAAPTSVAIGDPDGDGRPDLVIANSGSSDITLLLGNGSGGFSAAAGSPFAAGTDPFSVAIGDLNSDGRPDLAAANVNSNDVSVLLGNGSGGFSAAAGSPFAVGTAPISVAIGDLNGDGRPDLATANYSSNNVSVLLGNGSGGFSAAAGSPFAVGTNPISVAIGDLSGDGKPDLATANSASANVSFLLGNGSGGFSAAASSPFAVGATPVSVAIGDLNGDERPDVASANAGSNNVTALLNTSQPTASLSAASIGFGSQLVNTQSPNKAVSVTNAGEARLHVSEARIVGGGASSFAIARDSCSGGTFKVGEGCAIAVSFSPASAGAQSATLRITDDARNSPQAVALSGSGATPLCRGLDATIVGTSGPDLLMGTPARDVVALLDGNDTFKGNGGNDVVCGGSGDDDLRGLTGADSLKGGSGDDDLRGGFGNDTLWGGSGDDSLDGGPNNDVCSAGSDTDTAAGCETKNGVP
jgi:FG-GAP-like repeat/RTX calcium-binding nonapeptide repeat (4 copies)